MAQHDYTIANQGFPAFRSDLNDALAAIVSNNSGATEPTTMFAHQVWVDTAANPSILKIRNADNDAWITIGAIDQTGDTFILRPAAGSVSVPAYSTSGDTNTGIFFPAADTIGFAEGGVEAMRIDSSGNVGIGTSSPSYLLHLAKSSSSDGPQIRLENTNANLLTGSTAGSIDFYANDSSTGGTGISGFIKNVFQNAGVLSALTFGTRASGDATERMRITSSGEVLVGGTTEVALGGNGPGNLTIQRERTGTYQPTLNIFGDDQSIGSGDVLGWIKWFGNDTTSNTPTNLAYVAAVGSGSHAAGDNPTDLAFGVTADGTETVFEALRIRQDGTLDSQDTYDNTQTGSTVVVTSAGLIGRTSSSIKYKKDVETLNTELVDNAIANLRPVWYRTKDAKGDDKETWSHIGLIAEEVHEVEPRLVRYRTEKVEFVDIEEQVTKTREVSPAVTDEEGSVVQEAVTEEYTETVTRKEKQKSLLEIPEPEDVDYGRLAVLCLAKIQQQEQTIAALEARIAALEQA